MYETSEIVDVFGSNFTGIMCANVEVDYPRWRPWDDLNYDVGAMQLSERIQNVIDVMLPSESDANTKKAIVEDEDELREDAGELPF